MNPRMRGLIRLGILLAVFAVLCLIFPGALRFAQMAARELRYLWWVILLLALGIWLVWGVGRKPRE